jgi:DNA-binding transcriptional LysR family regulator
MSAPLGILLRSAGHEPAHYALVLATGAAAIGREVVLFATNAGCRLLLDPTPLLEDPREALLAARGVAGLRRLEFGTLEAIFGCVAAGLGVTLLPKSLIGPVWSDGRVAVHELPPSEALAETVFIRRRDAFVSSALAAFLKLARSGASARAAVAAE